MTTRSTSGRFQERTNLRRERMRRGWSENDAAVKLYNLGIKHGVDEDELGVDARAISRWELGKTRPNQTYTALLSLLYELPPERLDLPPLVLPVAPPPSDQLTTPADDTTLDRATTETTSLVPCGDGLALQVGAAGDEFVTFIVKRREFFEALGGGAATFFLSSKKPRDAPGSFIATDALSAAECRALGQAMGQSIERAWRIFHTADTEQMLAVAKAQLYMVNQHHAVLSPDVLLPYYSLTYRLIGATHHRRGDYEEALCAHNSAYLAALDGGDVWNMAESRSWQAYGMTALGRHSDSLQTIEAALRLLSGQANPDSTRLRARLFSSAASMAAALGDAKQADAMLHASEALLDQLPGLHEEFDRVAWLESAGVCALRLRRLELAITTLRQALSEVPTHWIARRVFTTIALSTALACARDRDGAIAVAREVIPQLQAAQSRELTQHFTGFLYNGLPANFPNDKVSQHFAHEAEAILAVDD